MVDQFSPVCAVTLQSAAGCSRARVQQAGAICFRISADSSPEVLLLASRRNGRWGIPKGRIETGETSGVAAAREAMEEAGVRGRISNDALGSFVYMKDSSDLTYHLDVHLLEVQETLLDFPERRSRKLRWAPLENAVQEVSHPKLRDLLLLLAGNLEIGCLLGGNLSP
ncbi:MULTISPECIES: NUDIX hydrolase [unclassified Ensifer]|uniref:NUDIX hydrolase n=1 Tax=unclassified Ensifer TaxID=2633371 RepID=UPI0009F5F8A4|nr:MULTISPECIES: NUDIX hydrolase [unclassified Ensifer]